jgi:hypothetical protein
MCDARDAAASSPTSTSSDGSSVGSHRARNTRTKLASDARRLRTRSASGIEPSGSSLSACIKQTAAVCSHNESRTDSSSSSATEEATEFDTCGGDASVGRGDTSSTPVWHAGSSTRSELELGVGEPQCGVDVVLLLRLSELLLPTALPKLPLLLIAAATAADRWAAPVMVRDDETLERDPPVGNVGGAACTWFASGEEDGYTSGAHDDDGNDEEAAEASSAASIAAVRSACAARTTRARRARSPSTPKLGVPSGLQHDIGCALPQTRHRGIPRSSSYHARVLEATSSSADTCGCGGGGGGGGDGSGEDWSGSS